MPITASSGTRGANRRAFGAITRQAITKHLQVLKSVGLVRGEMAGRVRLFELNAEPLLQAKDYLDLVSAQCDEALARLKAHVEPPP